MSHFVIGLDLGQARDYSALAIVEVVARNPLRLQCRHLERYPLGTTYPTIVSAVATLLATPALKVQGRAPALVVDGTGCGRAVVDLFNQARLRPIAVLVTGGDVVTHDAAYWKVPKRDLVAACQAPLQDGRLKFAPDMPLVDTLIKEMLNFKVKITTSANDTYGAWREGIHDDLLFAVMLASWWAQRVGGLPPVIFGTVKGRGGAPVVRSARARSSWGYD